MFFNKYPDQRYVFNLRSKDNLKHLLFEILEETPLSKTETGEPQADDDFLASIANKYDWVIKLQDLNKLEKIRGTYIDGILDREESGYIYTSLLQFGTTSGRYASRNPNLQNLPRPKEDDSGLSELVLTYTNAIRKGFIAPEGYVFIDADYSALEPRCFAHMSGDKNLQLIFHNGEDMYSAIAKRVFKLENVGTYKKDPNFLGKLYPEKRQIIKALALAVTYGAEAFRIGELLGVHRNEAQQLIDDYLNTYPGLKSYIKNCHKEAVTDGKVRTIFGRIRHLPTAMELHGEFGPEIVDAKWAKIRGLGDERREYKNKLNNSTNFKIQGLAAHIVNRAMIRIARQFKHHGIDGWVTLQVHDQIIAAVKAEQSDQAKKIVQECMEKVADLSVPLIAEPKIAYNLKDSH
jgi:DNA polymerase-1